MQGNNTLPRNSWLALSQLVFNPSTILCRSDFKTRNWKLFQTRHKTVYEECFKTIKFSPFCCVEIWTTRAWNFIIYHLFISENLLRTVFENHQEQHAKKSIFKWPVLHDTFFFFIRHSHKGCKKNESQLSLCGCLSCFASSSQEMEKLSICFPSFSIGR